MMSKSANKRLVVVLGMHRSGTSALTRSLQVLGIGLGQNLLPVAGDNEKGFWEDVDIHGLNVRILQSLGSDWHHLKRIHERDVQYLKEKGFVQEAAELLRSRLEHVDNFGFKDPRVAILLPFWKEVFLHCALQVDYIFAIRHPMSVGKSLQKRDGIDMARSYLLWLSYVVSSLEHGAENAGIIVDYDDFIRSPDRQIERLAGHLGLDIDAAALQQFRSEFLDADLRHTVYGAEDLAQDATCPPLVREIYDFLLDFAKSRDDLDAKVLTAKAAGWSEELARQEPTFSLIDRLSNANSALGQANAALGQANAALSGTLAERDAALANLSQTLANREETLEAMVKSTSWRITSPLRSAVVSRPFRSFRRLLASCIP